MRCGSTGYGSDGSPTPIITLKRQVVLRRQRVPPLKGAKRKAGKLPGSDVLPHLELLRGPSLAPRRTVVTHVILLEIMPNSMPMVRIVEFLLEYNLTHFQPRKTGTKAIEIGDTVKSPSPALFFSRDNSFIWFCASFTSTH